MCKHRAPIQPQSLSPQTVAPFKLIFSISKFISARAWQRLSHACHTHVLICQEKFGHLTVYIPVYVDRMSFCSPFQFFISIRKFGNKFNAINKYDKTFELRKYTAEICPCVKCMEVKVFWKWWKKRENESD